MNPVLARLIPAEGAKAGAPPATREKLELPAWLLRLCVAAGLVLILALAAVFEIRASLLQAFLLSRLDRGIHFTLEPGAGSLLRAPEGGPYDARLGYGRLPDFLQRLGAAGYAVDAQARPSARMRELVGRGLFPIYHEKSQAGLSVTDRAGRPLYEARSPEHVYESFEAIPPVIVRTLLFIENRELLDPGRSRLNPAVEWPRFAKAVGVDLLSRLGRPGQVFGASTLATQLEKFRHSPDGRTRSAREKLRQMVSASLRAYQDGTDTLATRRRIVLDYLNSMPLAAAPGHGEVLGLGDGLWAWYGTGFGEANRLLTEASASTEAGRARAYRQVLSLLLAARRPYGYLTEDRQALEDFTASYLRILSRAGVIDARLRDAALAQPLSFRTAGSPSPADFSERKGVNLVRTGLTTLLGVPALYDLDRLDLSVQSTLDGPAQEAVTEILQSLRQEATVRALGLEGFHLLGDGDPSRVIYSFTLYERGPRANLVRVQTDNLDQPLDINAGARLDLGSTAKLRTLITYLEIVAELHQHYAGSPPGALRARVVHPRDRLTAWAID